jgi:AcrR family transcriptional regulator
MSATIEKIDPRIKRTRKLLMDAFESLLSEKEFESITVQDITARATVNRATFYAHFTDKYQMVDQLIGDSFARILERRRTTDDDTPESYLRQLFLATADHWAGVHGRCRHDLFVSLAEAQVKRQLRDDVRQWLVEHGGTGQRERIDMIATIVTWSIYGAAMEWAKGTRKQTMETFADNVLPLIAASIEAARK